MELFWKRRFTGRLQRLERGELGQALAHVPFGRAGRTSVVCVDAGRVFRNSEPVCRVVAPLLQQTLVGLRLARPSCTGRQEPPRRQVTLLRVAAAAGAGTQAPGR